ncbi:MAG TPA: GHMP kinase [Candidatus Xenobia bacterium]|nr:GHMP kinase [Candidatus Xenobia bacterium]
MRFHAWAPTRIDLAGGTLDLWPLYLFHPGALTVNVAITRFAHAVAEPRRDRRLVLISRDSNQQEEFASLAALEKQRRYRLPLLAELIRYFAPSTGLVLTTWSEAPAGAGLGGSSAMAVAVCAALSRALPSFVEPSGPSRWVARGREHDWIALARDIEARVLGVPTGEQDHYPPVYGGANAIHLDPVRTRREPLRVPARELEARLVLVYTGKPRRSGINNWEVMKNYLDGDRALRRNFEEIATAARLAREALLRRDWKRLAEAMRRDAEARRRNAPTITTPFIEKLASVARRCGALASKVCGAGGGGCVVFLCEPTRKGEVASALASAGATLLPFRVSPRGVQVRKER